MKLILLEIILFKALLLTSLVNAKNTENMCGQNFRRVVIDNEFQCIPDCKPQCINALCSPETIKCICNENYEKNGNDYECIEKPSITTTILPEFSSLKGNFAHEDVSETTTQYPCKTECINGVCSPETMKCTCNKNHEKSPGNDNECIESTKSITTILPEFDSMERNFSGEDEKEETLEPTEITHTYTTTEFSNETNANETITEYPSDTTELPILMFYNVTKTLDDEGDINCRNGKYFNGTCYCRFNYRFNAKFKSCDEDDYYNESLLFSGANDTAQTNNHSKFFIIGYVILAMILLLAILSVIIIYLLLKDSGSAYNVDKYEKKYGSQHTKRYSDEIELHEIPLAKGTDNKYYDAERFLDDRQHI